MDASKPARGNIIGQLLQAAPLIQASVDCGQVSSLFQEQPTVPVFVVAKPDGGFGLVDRNSFLTTYLKGFNRDLYLRRPISALYDSQPLVVDYYEAVDEVGLLITSQYPQALKSAFIITRAGEYAGIGQGADLLRAVAKFAQAANAAKSTFLASMSHELRTPLNGVIGNLELLSTTELSGEQIELARTASVSAATLLDLIGDLLDLNKIEADRLELEMIDCDVRTVVQGAFDIVSPKARQKDIRLRTFIDATVPARLRSDPLRLRQVLVNFAGNAVKFVENGGVFLNVRCEATGPDTVQLLFEVVDTGPGFNPARAASLFEAFTQEDSSTTRKHGGTGLGLTIAKKIIELMNGEIGCSTEPGFGSTFWCTVPAQVVEWAAPPEVPSTTLWLLDDTESRERLGQELQGLPVTILSEGLENRAKFDVAVIVDDGLPQTLHHLARARATEQTVVLVSQAPTSIRRYEAHRSGADYIVDRQDIAPRLGAILASLKHHRDAVQRHALPAKLAEVDAPVLVLDDTSTNRDLATRQLGRFGLRCETAEHGLEGLTMSKEKDYALIFVDGSMPVMDGIEFARAFREREAAEGRRRTPLIAMTAHAIAGDSERFIAAGMDDYLAKPVTLEKLRAKVMRWLKVEAGAAPAAPPPAASVPTTSRAIDREALNELLGEDNAEMRAGLLSVFVSDSPKALLRINRALEADDRDELARAAHAAKSAAGSSGARTLTTMLKDLEMQARNAPVDVLNEQLGRITAEFARAQADARDLIAEAPQAPAEMGLNLPALSVA